MEMNLDEKITRWNLSLSHITNPLSLIINSAIKMLHVFSAN